MPVIKHGVGFKYFDKALCALVALGLVGAIVFTLGRVGSREGEVLREEVERGLREVETQARQTHVKSEAPDFLPDIERRLTEVRPARILRDIIYPPLPQSEGTLRVSTNREFLLKFSEPLEKGSVTVTGDGALVTILEHPADGDYRAVRARSGSKNGQVRVEGISKGAAHLYTVIVDAEAGKMVSPPKEISAEGAGGMVTLTLKANPLNAEGGVQIAEYEVWRRDWEDPLGEYRKVFSLGASEVAAAGRGRGGGLGARGAEALAEKDVAWEDTGVSAGESYSYRVRTVGANTYPRESEFTDSVMVEVPPETDFRFTRRVSDKVGCDVLMVFADGPRKQSFQVSIGDEIGGVVRDPMTGENVYFQTGDVMVDFHPNVLLPGIGMRDRMLYADRNGYLQQRLRNEGKSDLWAQVDGTAPGLTAGVSAGARSRGRYRR